MSAECNCVSGSSGLHTIQCNKYISPDPQGYVPSVYNYETITVDDHQQKLQRLCDSQDRQISRLEQEIERLQDRIKELVSGYQDKSVVFAEEKLNSAAEAVEFNPTKGVVLKSQFRDNIESRLRAKAIQKQEGLKG